MAVSTTDTYSGPYEANGVTVAFPFTFKAASASELSVVVVNELDVEVPVQPSAYTVSINDAGGTVLFASAPAGGNLYIISAPSFLQEVSFFSGQPFRPEVVNDVNDRFAAKALVLKNRADRSLQVPFNEIAPSLPPQLARLGKLLGFDVNGDAVALDPDIDFGAGAINDYGQWNAAAPLTPTQILPDWLRTEALDLRRFGLIDSTTMDQSAAMEGVAAYVNATPNGCAINWASLQVNISRPILFTKPLRLSGATWRSSKLLCRDDGQLKFYGLRVPYNSDTFTLENLWIATEGRHASFPLSVEYQDGYLLPDASLAPTLMMRDVIISGRNAASGFVGGLDLLNVPWPRLDHVTILGDQVDKTSDYGVRYRGKHGSMHAFGLRCYFVENGLDIEGSMEGIVVSGHSEMVAVRNGVRYADNTAGLQPYFAIDNSHINAERCCIKLEGIDQFEIGGRLSLYGNNFDGAETLWTGIDIYGSTSGASVVSSGLIAGVLFNGEGQTFGKQRYGVRINGNETYEAYSIDSNRFQGLDIGVNLMPGTNGVTVGDSNDFINTIVPIVNGGTGKNRIKGLGYRYPVDRLPDAATYAGERLFVIDSSVTTWGAPVAGGGTAQVPVYSDGSIWRVG